MNKWQILLDILMCLSLAGFVFLGIKQGFIKSFFQYTKLTIVIIITMLLGAYLVGFCQEQFVAPRLEDKVSAVLVEKAESAGDSLKYEDLTSGLPSIVKKVLNARVFKSYFESLKGSAVEVADKLGEKIENVAISVISKIMAYFITFVLAYVLCTILIIFIERIFELPVLNGVNKILGSVWGLSHAYVFLSFAACVALFLFGSDFVEGTIVTRLIYKIGLFTR
jgi:uncharacterized membrane protein required for colicin V production